MKVILNQTVPKVGKQGTVVVVADGYARNYLFPKGLAILADKKQLEVLERKQARASAKVAGAKAGADELRDQINGKSIRIEGKVGGDGKRLFGAITSQDVVDHVKKQLGITVEKKQVALIDPIKRLGDHQVHLDLHNSVDAIITVTVFDPNAVAAVAAPTPTPVEAEPEEAAV